MRKIISLAFIICSILILASCENKNEVADEIVHYYNNEWAPINNMKEQEAEDIADELDEFERRNETNKAANLYRDEMISMLDDVLKQFESVDPANKIIKKWNDMQIESDEHFKEFSKDIVAYYQDGEVTEQDLEETNDELEQKQENVLNYRDELMDEYDLKEVEDNHEDKKFPKIKRAEDE